MNLPTFLYVTQRLWREMKRNHFTLIMLLLLPGFMIFVFFFAFSSVRTAGATTYNIVVINNDRGLAEEIKGVLSSDFNATGLTEETIENGFAVDLIELMNTTTYPGEEIRIFNVYQTEQEKEEEARKLIESREIDGLIVFPKGFSNATMAAVNNAFYIQNGIYIHELINNSILEASGGFLQYTGPPFPTRDNTTVEIVGDNGHLNYQIVEKIVTLFISEYAKELSSLNYPVEITIEPETINVRDYSVFDIILPGMIIFGILTQAGILSAFLSSEIQTPNKTISRLRLSLIQPWEYIVGASTLQLVISPAQIAVLLGMSFILGFQPEGDIIQGFIICWLTTLFTLGLTFVAAAVFTSPDAAGMAIGFGVTPLAFASGAFMDAPKITLIPDSFPTATGALRDFTLWDLLPSTHAISALRSVLLYNFSLIDVIAEIIFLTVLNVLLLAFSIAAYSKRRFTGDI
ncbi:MAG: ABC transporter permease [Candidatus Heimdallarchaeota archaeon]|nr:MAG: ABC transporter permease [Candidatus Heimdallarchaeota archaeon]